MAKVSIYLLFERNTKEAFDFYKSVFQSEITSVNYFRDIPPTEGQPQLSEEDKDLIMNIQLPILGDNILMGTDSPQKNGFKLNVGNNINISLEPDSREESERIFKALSEGGNVTMNLQDMFWGAYYGSVTDKFNINWMINCENKK